MKVLTIAFFFMFLYSNSFLSATEASLNNSEIYQKTSTSKHDMRVINSGIASLYARVDMIRRAKESIDLESYIFNPDTSGRIILKELVAAAKRGVKVRILVDKFITVFKMDEYIAQELKKNNIELRYYNPASLLKISSVQFRNHRKLMVRDGEEAITGGRNIGDEYFDLSEDFNFLDRDVTVEGEVVKSMQGSFNQFWNSKLVEIPKEVKVPESRTIEVQDINNNEQKIKEHRKKLNFAASLLYPKEEDDKVLAFIDNYGKETFLENNKYNCPEVAFASDKEGASFFQALNTTKYNEKYRLLQQEIDKWMDTKIKDENDVVVDTPYFLSSSLSDRLLNYLKKKKTKIKIFTNSLASTDAIHVASVFSDKIKSFTPFSNFKAYVYKGKFSGESKLYSEKIKTSTWGTHAKTIVFNDESFMVGTYNVDNRSSHYNTEMAIFCSGSPKLANDVKKNISLRMYNSFGLNSEAEPDDCTDLYKDVSKTKKALFYLLKIPSTLFEFLL
ncbi:MAG: phospholipase D family protein [Bacteriovorax sp.]|nr:phospholipase D family protein [Bacteriovorax sp.]